MKFLITLLVIFALKQCVCDEIPGINLKQGILLGKVEKTLLNNQNYLAFRGIPFAEPPTGALRFKPPKPHDGWDNNLEAFKNKPTCMQLNTRGRFEEPLGVSGSEDCLYINIYTPNIKGNAAVLVFDYNDNFRTGFNGSDAYSPDFFIEENVVVVTISNRLGIFGYLTTEDDVIPGNNGLRDFILGLEWLNSNIEKFGGDATRITLMGSRGGAAIVDILLHSKKAKGLFSGAILQSGTSLEAMYFIDNPRKKAFDTGMFLNITASNSEELLVGLQNTDAEKIINADVGILMSSEVKDVDALFFMPTVETEAEDAVLSSLPENSNVVNDVPVIIGFNSREGADLLSHLFTNPRLLGKNNEKKKIFQLPIRTDYTIPQKSAKFKEVNTAVIDYYFKDKSLNYNNLMEYAGYTGDLLHIYPIHLTANNYIRRLSSAVYFYVFDFRGQWNHNSNVLATMSRVPLGNSGALVLDELCYLFICSRIRKNYQDLIKLPSKQPELKVLKKLVRIWSNFAKTGNPTPTQDDPVLSRFKWEPFSDETDAKYLHITKTLKMQNNPMGKRKKFWDELLENISKEVESGELESYVEKDEDPEDEVQVDEEEEVNNEEFDKTLNENKSNVDGIRFMDNVENVTDKAVHEEL